MLDFNRLTTPPNDGDLLIEPQASHWPRLIEKTRRQQETDTLMFAGVPATAVRQATRTALFGDGADTPVIACGHQPAFVHPGVWAKDIAVHHVAEHLGFQSTHIIADNDTLHSSVIQVPVVQSDMLLALHEVALGPAPAGAAYEGQPRCSKPEIENARQAFENLLGERFTESAIGDFLDGLSQFHGCVGATHRAPSASEGVTLQHQKPIACAPGSDKNNTGNLPERPLSPRHQTADFVQQYLAARARVDTPLGAGLQQVRISQGFGGPFVADLLLNPDRFAQAYNDALAEYRRQQRVRSQQRPLPDLGKVGELIETALWIYRPLEQRQRLWVSHKGNAIHLYADQTPVGTLSVSELRRDPDATFTALYPLVIRPRALTLTLWARLLVCDLFVHGIGGAKYDRITDGVLQQYYHCEPTPFACVSATLRLPLPRQPASAGELASALRDARDVRFNPDRYLRNAPTEMLAERSRLIGESIQLRGAHAPSYARRQTFLGIRQINARLLETNPRVERQLAVRIDRLRSQLHSNRIANGREYFYALQPQERLIQLAERIITACSRVG